MVEFLTMPGPNFFADQLASLKMATVVAVGVYRLAFESFRFLANHLAGCVTDKLHALPIGVGYNRIGFHGLVTVSASQNHFNAPIIFRCFAVKVECDRGLPRCFGHCCK